MSQHKLYLCGMLWSSGLPCCQQLKINLGVFKKECSNSQAASLLLDNMSKEHLLSQVKTVYTQGTSSVCNVQSRPLTHLSE